MNDSWFKKLFKTNLKDTNAEREDVEINIEEAEKGAVLTIGRELGSGGRKVAKEVARRLRI